MEIEPTGPQIPSFLTTQRQHPSLTNRPPKKGRPTAGVPVIGQALHCTGDPRRVSRANDLATSPASRRLYRPLKFTPSPRSQGLLRGRLDGATDISRPGVPGSRFTGNSQRKVSRLGFSGDRAKSNHVGEVGLRYELAFETEVGHHHLQLSNRTAKAHEVLLDRLDKH